MHENTVIQPLGYQKIIVGREVLDSLVEGIKHYFNCPHKDICDLDGLLLPVCERRRQEITVAFAEKKEGCMTDKINDREIYRRLSENPNQQWAIGMNFGITKKGPLSLWDPEAQDLLGIITKAFEDAKLTPNGMKILKEKKNELGAGFTRLILQIVSEDAILEIIDPSVPADLFLVSDEDGDYSLPLEKEDCFKKVSEIKGLSDLEGSSVSEAERKIFNLIVEQVSDEPVSDED